MIYPERLVGDDGVYRDEVITLKKAMVVEGVDTEYLHETEHRKWEGFKGAGILVPLIISAGSSGAVAALQSWLTGRFGKDPVRLKLGRSRAPDGEVAEWFEAEGTADEVASLLESFKEWTDDD
ncbi:MAG: hypothetical protein ACYDH6_19250 [Acidimicrobiales bacterium]